MKYKYLLLGIVILLSTTGCFWTVKYKPKKIIKDIKKFHFSYSTGNYIYGSVSYEIKIEDEKYILAIKPDGVEEEKATKIDIDDVTIENVLNILNKYNVKGWNGFNKSDMDVLDGNSFSMSITEKDDTNTSAHGYMMWHDNYHKVKEELDKLFKNILEENKEN